MIGGLDLEPAIAGLTLGLTAAVVAFLPRPAARYAPAVAALVVALVVAGRETETAVWPVVAVAFFVAGDQRAREHPDGWLGVAVGAAVLASSLPDTGLTWYALVAFLALGAAGVAVTDWRVRLLVVVGGMGVAATVLAVPDTEEVLTATGAFLPLGLVGLAAPRRLESTIGWSALLAMVAWTVTLGAAGRVPAALGGWACLGVVVILAAATHAGWRAGDLRRAVGGVAVAVVAVQLVLVLVASRAIPHLDPGAAALAVAALIGVAAGALAVIARVRPVGR